MKATSNRGGARERREAQRNSANGLLGISFVLRHRKGQAKQPVLSIVVGTRRFTRGTKVAGVREAMRQAIKLRRDAGLKAPGLERAIKAFQVWRGSF